MSIGSGIAVVGAFASCAVAVVFGAPAEVFVAGAVASIMAALVS